MFFFNKLKKKCEIIFSVHAWVQGPSSFADGFTPKTLKT